MSWAERLNRVFNIDIEVCGHCGESGNVIACIEDQNILDRPLAHLRDKDTTSSVSRFSGCCNGALFKWSGICSIQSCGISMGSVVIFLWSRSSSGTSCKKLAVAPMAILMNNILRLNSRHYAFIRVGGENLSESRVRALLEFEMVRVIHIVSSPMQHVVMSWR